MTSDAQGRPSRWAIALLWTLMVVYTVTFSTMSIRQHDAQRTYTSDLGQIDLSVWNTGQGRLLYQVKGDQPSTRMTDHVEPIFVPVSLVFRLWDDVRSLLVLQSATLALGALPVFYLAFDRLARSRPRHSPAAQPSPLTARLSLAALAFAVAYLLYPPVQAANLADFHALPLATPLILSAFLFIERRRWIAFAVAALLVAAVQEGMALLTALLGLYVLALGALDLRRRGVQSDATSSSPTLALVLGGFVLLAGVAWFYVATFRLIPAYSAAAYGLAETPYAARFGALGDSFGDVVRSLLTRPLLVLRTTADPMRLGYLFKLLAPVGFLALAGPEILLLGAPLLLANLLSGFAFQYSGQLHYSAPLAAYALTAAIIGSARLRHMVRRAVVALHRRRLWRAHRGYLLLVAWLLAWSIGCQIAYGYTPIGAQFRHHWPQVTPHHRLLSRFLEQIPAEARVSTMPVLYPHLSHRQFLYSYPIVADAEYILLDAAAQSGWPVHPLELRDQVVALLQSGHWKVQDAADGYLLLRRSTAPVAPAGIGALPAEFYTFAQPSQRPQIPLDITFGGRLRLLGYDVIPDERWRSVGLRFYWQALDQLPDDLRLRAFALAPNGDEVDNERDRPLLQPLWYRPAAWPVGEVIVTEKLAWYLPKQWAPAVGVYQGENWDDLASRWPAVDQTAADASHTMTFEDNTWVRLDAWEWRRGQLVTPPTPPAFEARDDRFGGDGWIVRLTGVAEPERSAPGRTAPITLRWQAENQAPRDYTVFLHLRDASGRTVAQADATPHWYGPLPTSQWPAGITVLDAHALALPADLPPGVYDVVVGWYYWETQERLALLDADGLPVSDGALVARLEVDATVGPGPDLACRLVPESCASQ